MKVSTQNKVPETPAQLHMAVMAAICGLKDAQPNRILRSVFRAGLDDFISIPHQAYCYDFISEWLHSDKVNSSETGRQGEPVRAGRCPGAEGGLGRDIRQLYDVAQYVEDKDCLYPRFEKLSVDDLAGTECFPCIHEVILGKLMTEISDVQKLIADAAA